MRFWYTLDALRDSAGSQAHVLGKENPLQVAGIVFAIALSGPRHRAKSLGKRALRRVHVAY